ncbi:MAG: hypothetical protein L7S46_01540, partial [Candidatus Poseidoniaceae archaeon]|nr:hypothetical protein [Candidatus Poseidoniaceae archaeon]
MNKLRAVLFALMMLTVSLAGCFGSDDPDEGETPVETLDDWQVHFASTAADLPTCDSATDGRLYYVDADSEFQVCTSSGWDVIDVSGPAGQDGADGTSGTNGVDGADGSDGIDGADGANGVSTLIRILSSTTCTTGGNSFEIGADNNGDGVLDITEVIVTVDICNGVAGPAGQDGVDGNDGADGASGIDGTNGTDGQNGADGTDGTNGTDGQDGAPGNPGADGNDGANGTNGTDGIDGNDGNSTLMVMTNLSSSSSNCWGDGGVQIDVGVDDNKNGVLDSSEIDDTTYICYGGDGADGNDGNDGADGTDGTNGTDGVDGNDGTDGVDGNDGADGADGNDGADGTNGSASPNTMLTSISSPAASLGCNAGGRVMMQGLDNGDGGGTAQNGVLESGEV